jgi:hypothetical protein
MADDSGMTLHLSLTTNPPQCHTLIPSTYSHFIIDPGASLTITNCATDFLKPPTLVKHMSLQGIASGLHMEGLGTATYSFWVDNQSIQQVILNNVLLCPPSCPYRLLCPRLMAEHTAGENDGLNSLRGTDIPTDHNQMITEAYNKHTGLPMLPLISAMVAHYGFTSTARLVLWTF